MKPRERQAGVVDLIRKHGRISVEELVARFGTSPETIRRDLSTLASAGNIQKIHGGATLPLTTGEGPFQQRMGLNIGAKRHIARKARELVYPGDTLLIDTGSTTLMFAEELAGIDDLTVITNSAEIARIVAAANATARVFLVGGAYNVDNRQTCGIMAISQLRAFRGKLAMLTFGALDAAAGVTDYNLDEAEVARGMIEQAERAVILGDSSKFNLVAPFAVGPLGRFDTLVCEAEPPGPILKALYREEVAVSY